MGELVGGPHCLRGFDAFAATRGRGGKNNGPKQVIGGVTSNYD
jgi:hypothetical protein